MRYPALTQTQRAKAIVRAAKICKIRALVGWRQKDLARTTGFSAGYISMMEQGVSLCPSATWRIFVAAIKKELAKRDGADSSEGSKNKGGGR